VEVTGVDQYSPFGLADDAPTAVELVWFTAAPAPAAVQLGWETVSEVDNLGFNLYRSDAPDGEYIRLNDDLIPSQLPGSPVGFVYEWIDRGLQPGMTYYYKLESVDFQWRTALYGPVWATPLGTAYAVYLPVVAK